MEKELNHYTLDRFLQTLFQPGELTCFASSPYDTELASKPSENSLWFSINPVHTSRKDENVTCYRNFLIELDSVPLTQQIEIVRSKVPVTSIVYSGGKSYHFIISLKEPVKTEAEYRRVIRGLMEAIPEADKSTKNPSRLSRLPFRLRPDTRLNQELIYLGDKVDLAKLPEPAPYHEPKAEKKETLYVNSLLLTAMYDPDAYITAHFSGRNQFFYWVGKRCSELNYTKEQKKITVTRIYDKLKNKKNFGIREAFAAARVKD